MWIYFEMVFYHGILHIINLYSCNVSGFFYIILNSFDCAIFLLRYHVSACPPIYCLCRDVHITSVPLWAGCHWCSETLCGIELLYPPLISATPRHWHLNFDTYISYLSSRSTASDKRQKAIETKKTKTKGKRGAKLTPLSSGPHRHTHDWPTWRHKSTVLCGIQ